jgi:cobalt/nickel transport system permease protein
MALQFGAFSVVMETLLSGKSELPFGTFILFMQPIHLVIGIVEGFIAAGFISYVKSARPEIIENIEAFHPLAAGIPAKKILIVFVILAVITGGALSWFASSHPDGLEWSIEKITGKKELAKEVKGIALVLQRIQEKTAFLPEYNFQPAGKNKHQSEKSLTWPGIEAGTSVAGVVGGGIVLGLVVLIGFGIRFFQRPEDPR